MRRDDEKTGLRDVYDVSQAYSKFFFFYCFVFFLLFFILATDYDKADMDGDTRDVEHHKDNGKTGLRDIRRLSGIE